MSDVTINQPFCSQLPCSKNCSSDCIEEDLYSLTMDASNLGTVNRHDDSANHFVKPPVFQKGILRTNCIDCLDRTNVAQYVYGLVALAHQLHVLGYIDVPSISLDSHLADDLMTIYEAMGDTLALQYGGSAAHNKIFSERRGQWKATTQSQEFFRTLQRYYSNAYMDAEKQDAINMFLGHFQPQQGKPALWELDSDQHYSVGKRGSADQHSGVIIKRSLSDGSILCDSTTIDGEKILPIGNPGMLLPVKLRDSNVGLLESTPEVATCENNSSYPKCTPPLPCKKLLPDMPSEQNTENDSLGSFEHGDSFDCSNFLDVDWLSSSENSCEEETYGRSMLVDSPFTSLSSVEIVEANSSYLSGSSLKGKEVATGELSEVASSSSSDLTGFSDRFIQWVMHGDVHFP